MKVLCCRQVLYVVAIGTIESIYYTIGRVYTIESLHSNAMDVVFEFYQ